MRKFDMSKNGDELNVLIRKRFAEITVIDAINKVSSKAVVAALKAYDETECPKDKTGTTIRLPNSVYEFYSVIANELDISLQNAIVISLIGLVEAERAKLSGSNEREHKI